MEGFECIHQCPEGRIVGAHFYVAGGSCLLFSVYAPAEGPRRVPFFTGPLRAALREAVERHPGAKLLVAGDFNCIECVSLDQVGGNSCTGRTVGFSPGLQPLQLEFGLADSFRALRPVTRAFTHRATSGTTAARLDRILVSDTLVPHLLAAGMQDGWEGDHRLVFATLTPPNALPRGPGDWVFPADLLVDSTFMSTMTSHFQSWFLRHPVTPSYTHAQRWEAFKIHARDRIRLYQLQRSKRPREHRRRLAQQAAVAAAAWARSPHDATAADAWGYAQEQLSRENRKAAQRAAVYAGVLWEDWGESSTAWFHRLAEQRTSDSTIASLELPAAGPGQPPAASAVSLADPGGRRAAADHIADFYDGSLPSGLFHPRPTDPSARRSLLYSIDRTLSQNDRTACEGGSDGDGITAGELQAALKRCARGKAPGSDGLTYEFYRAFWPVIGEPLAQVCSEAFTGGDTGRLPDSMLLGTIVLVYKGAKAGPRSRVTCYRPITLLNCDYKILARAITIRVAPALCTVIDTTQTAFLPDRWIGDNVLQHLEEIDYLDVTHQPGVIAFLDFEKAYDAISRPWVLDCMRSLGFGPRAVQWVRLLMAGTRARCRFNGFHTRDFDVSSGVAQGSPLSPALYVIAAQPLASRLRQLQRDGTITGIMLPAHSPAPPSAQHADDTTIHVKSLSDLSLAWQHAVVPFCAASGSRANASKTKAMLLGAAAAGHSDGFKDAATGVEVVGKDEPVRHLGIMLAPGPVGEHARAAKFTAIAHAVLRRVSHWSAYGLSHDGRAHLAQQCMASMLVYHATFTRPPNDVLARVHRSLMRFVDGSDTVGGPCRAVLHLRHAQGGRGVPCLPRIVDALQAGIICRLLHPARVPWKTLAAWWWQSLPSPCAGLRSLLSAGGLASSLPPRVAGYVEGFRACMPHRTSPLAQLPSHHCLLEPLFNNPSVLSAQQRPLQPQAFPAAVAAGISCVADLVNLTSQLPPPPPALLTEAAQLRGCLPSPLSLAITTPPQDDTHEWWEWPALALTPGRGGLPEQVVRREVGGGRAKAYRVEIDGSLTEGSDVQWPLPADRPAGPPCLAVRAPSKSLDPAEQEGARATLPARAAAEAAGASTGRLYYVGPWAYGARAPLDPSQWGLAGTPLLQSTTRQRTAALLQRDAAHSKPATGAGFVLGQPVEPAVWPAGDGRRNRLTASEQRWVALLSPQSRHRRPARHAQRADPELVNTASWMRECIGRLSIEQRRQQRIDQQLLQAASQQPRHVPARAKWWVSFDDPKAGVPELPRRAWHKAWRDLRSAPVPRAQRFLAWRIMHGSLPCAARLAAWHRTQGRPPDHDRRCLRQGCAAAGHVETITHAFLDCPVARQVQQWVGALFHAVTQHEPPPPGLASVWLAGDHSQWDPGISADLWHIFRLATLHFLWAARCRGRSAGRPVAAMAIIAQLVHYLRGRIADDAVRAFTPLLEFAATGGEWLPDRPTLTETEFLRRWAHRGVLCTWTQPSGPLRIRLSMAHPVPPSVPSDTDG